MKLQDFVKTHLINLSVPDSKKEIILNLIKTYNLSEAQQVLNSCVSQDGVENNNILLMLVAEIDKHIEMFNDDLEADEVIYNDLNYD